jgi:hypothetical protein
MKPLRGWTYKRPDGTIGARVMSKADNARIDAAMACNGHGSCVMPTDWYRAHRRGWRIVRVQIVRR